MTVSVAYETELDSRINAFEAMHERMGCADIAEFLPPVDHALYLEILVELVRVDLEYQWRSETPQSLKLYLERFPILAANTTTLQAICFEEYRQRLQNGDIPNPADYQLRYHISTSHWPSSHRVVKGVKSSQKESSGPPFPQVGERFLGFQLESELGRGAFARVYLARQGELSERPVALKISRARFSDANTLARLQHTNIVPIYSVHREDIWEAVCMPYFGAHTLADLPRSLRNQPTVPNSGKFILDTVMLAHQLTQRHGEMADIHAHITPLNDAGEFSPGFQELANVSYVTAILILVKKIASALAHAHERGVIHRDLKPANILLADDGEPMLLDFNLSADSFSRKSTSQDFIGGTLPYMAPEQLQAFQNHTANEDTRSDIFSLGIILFELLTGKSPFPVHTGNIEHVIKQSYQDRQALPTNLATLQPAMTPALQAIVLKCLAPVPEQRYQSAQALVEDLDCQINDLPLKHTPEPSLIERAKKWTRRHPRIMSSSGIATIAGVLLAIMAGLFAVRGDKLENMQAQAEWQAFQRDLQQAQVQMTASPIADREQLTTTINTCEQALSHFTESQQSESLVKRLSQEQQEQLRHDVAELHFLLANTKTLQADFAATSALRKEQLQAAQSSHKKAAAYFVNSELPVSFREQEIWLQQELDLPLSSLPKEIIQPITSRDLCQRACLLASQRRFQHAANLWQQASLRDPKNIWVWYGLGHCLEQLDQPGRAAECYSACIALNPEFFGWYFNRGRMRMQLKDYALARDDFQVALQLNSKHAETYINLAIAQSELKAPTETITAVQQAIVNGYNEPRAYQLLAQAYIAMGNTAAAKQATEKSGIAIPTQEHSWISRGVAHAKSDPLLAVSDFDQALHINAHSLAALESKSHVLAEILNRPADAIEVLNLAVKHFPEHAPSLASRGVLFAREKRRENALADAQKALSIDRSPAMLYQVAGIHALLSIDSPNEVSRALELLSSALRQGYGAELIHNDPDLNPIRNLAEFQTLLEALQVLQPKSST